MPTASMRSSTCLDPSPPEPTGHASLPVHRAGEPRVVIIGAGACGLACARGMSELGHDKWVILEADTRVGGLAASTLDENGFTWELGGHVVFGDSGAFQQLVFDAIPKEELIRHHRSSAIYFAGRFIPYPFQRHIRHLPPDVAFECLSGLVKAALCTPDRQPRNFLERVVSTFGEGLTRYFFEPYNSKVWRTPLDKMDDGWIADRIAPVDWQESLWNVIHGHDSEPWGPNREFVFPAEGGIGRIWESIAGNLGAGLRLGTEVATIDARAQIAYAVDGSEWPYDVLVSTMPIDILVSRLLDCPDDLRRAAKRLIYTQVQIVGLGYEAPLSNSHNWLYFPDPHTPFYRATNTAKYTPSSVPRADVSRYSAWLTETACRPEAAIDSRALALTADRALRNLGLVPRYARVASTYVTTIPRAYPVPTLDRDRQLLVIQPWLAAHRILSRGRLGTWKYEIGNMDHAVKMGVDLARLILRGVLEELA